jgi:hypothetical protein
VVETAWPTVLSSLNSASQARQMFSAFSADGIVRGVGSQLAMFADSSGMWVKLPTGAAVVAGAMYNNSAQMNIAVANGGASPRIDRGVVRYTFSTGAVNAVAKQGTPNATPVPPALQRDTSVWELSLGQIAVAAGLSTSLAPGTVTPEPVWAGGHAGTYYTQGGGGAGGLSNNVITFLTVPAQGFPYQLRCTGTLLLDISDGATGMDVMLRDGGSNSDGGAAWGGANVIDKYQVRNGGGTAKLTGVVLVPDGLRRAVCLYVNRVSGGGTGATYVDSPSNRIDLIVEPL